MESLKLKYINELNIESFTHMLDDMSECYKLYWLSALLELFSRGKTEIDFDDMINKMIVDAWYSVAEYRLHLGPKKANGETMNNIERAIIKLEKKKNIPNDADEKTILELIKSNEKIITSEKIQLSYNVPYRLLSSFMPEIKGSDKIWSQKENLIQYINLLNENDCLPYRIINGVALKKKVVINHQWQNFFSDNYVTIKGWIEINKIKYLQKRNPGVPGIIYKLAPENDRQRKLKNVRDLWNTIVEISPVYDIYNKKKFSKNGFDVDHFIPWSFVANDELWNLIPMDSSLNSSKSNKLPAWEKYFSLFADAQYTMYEKTQQYDNVRKAFEKCKRDNLIMPWSLEHLYVPNCEKSEFMLVLEKNLKSIYDSAKMQGFEQWKM